jgi:hypothetical protein
MAANSKQFGTHGEFPSKQVNEVSIANLENKVNDLTFFYAFFGLWKCTANESL